MQTSQASWIQALRSPHDVLRAMVKPLGGDELAYLSHVPKWSVSRTERAFSGS